MNKAWPLVKLGEVLHVTNRQTEVNPSHEYRLLGVRLDGGGPFLREQKFGSQLAANSLYEVKSGDFIYSRLFAWRGAFGVIDEQLDSCFVSNEFPTFLAENEKIDAHFLKYWFRLPHILKQVEADCTGSTPLTRNRYKENFFLNLQIPLPPLAEQQRIVAKIERLAGKIEEATDQRNKSIAETAFLYKSAYRKIIGDSPQRDWVPLEKIIVDIENGWSPACHKNPAENTNWGVIKVGAVSFGYFNHKENKELPPSFQPKPQYEIKSGDFLMSRANTKELVGACALVRDTPPRLMLCDKVFRFIFHNDNRLNPAYLDHVLKSPALRAQIETGATGTSPTMKNISKSKIMQLLIPVPTIHDQIRIVRYFDLLKSKVASLKATQSQTAAELDAMLPSILDKAFKGEL